MRKPRSRARPRRCSTRSSSRDNRTSSDRATRSASTTRDPARGGPSWSDPYHAPSWRPSSQCRRSEGRKNQKSEGGRQQDRRPVASLHLRWRRGSDTGDSSFEPHPDRRDTRRATIGASQAATCRRRGEQSAHQAASHGFERTAARGTDRRGRTRPPQEHTDRGTDGREASRPAHQTEGVLSEQSELGSAAYGAGRQQSVPPGAGKEVRDRRSQPTQRRNHADVVVEVALGLV